MIKPKRRKSAKLGTDGRNPPFTPTQAMREQVEALSAYGVPQDVIAQLTKHPKTGKPLGERTLQRYFAHELAIGVWKLVGDVAQTLAQSAKGTPVMYDAQGRVLRAERAPDTTAAIFLLKARGGYVDRVQFNAAGKDGSPASVVIAIVPAETKL